MIFREVAYRWYVRRLATTVARGPIPRHIALVMDGNRRWARQMGYANPSIGHRYGAEHLDQVLGWCREAGLRHVSVFVASADNVRKRGTDEVQFLMDMIEQMVTDRLGRPTNPWRLHLAGRLDVLPESTRNALKLAEEATRDRVGLHLTVAVGYDGRTEIVDAVRSLLDDAAQAGESVGDLALRLTADDIATHLDTGELPEPDLVIRTSGERRMSGFLLWQAAGSQLYFCDVYWPGFRRIDFLRALRSYAARQRSVR